MSHKILRNIRFLLVLVALLVAVLTADALGLFAGADRFFYDTFLRLRGSRVCSNRIVIVAIDAQTLAALGRWPLARTYYAEMLNRLGEARFVGFDLLFMEPSSDDKQFVQAIERHGRVALAEYLDNAVTPVRPLIQSSVLRTGHVHIEPGVDNTVRELFHSIYNGNVLLPSLSSVIYEGVTGHRLSRQIKPVVDLSQGTSGKAFQQDLHKINFYGPPGSFRQISLAQVLDGTVSQDFFRDKIVVVGLTVPGIVDEVSTPFSQSRNRMSGVEVHANSINNLLDRSWIRDLPVWWVRAGAFLLALGASVILMRLSERSATLVWLFCLLFFPLCAFTLLVVTYQWLPPVLYLVAFSVVFFATYLHRLDSAARKLDREYAVMVSLLGSDAGAIPIQEPARSGVSGFLSEGGLNEKIQRQTDMTARLAQLHTQLAAALKTEHEALDTQIRFVEMLSHEYRTPLAIIRANLDILEMKDEVRGGHLSNNFAKMKRAMSRLVEVMDTSLGRERLEGTHANTREETVVLADFLQVLLAEARELWTERQLQLHIRKQSLCVSADSPLLKTALLNLIDNAVKYSAESEPVHVFLSADGENAEIVVKNRGVPIEADDLNRVFEKYFRGSSSVSTQGAGLGLYLVKKIIEQMGGSIGLVYTEAEGTVATVLLPVRFSQF